MTFAPSEDSDQPGLTPSLISLRCPQEGTLVTAKTDHFVDFVMRRLILLPTGLAVSVQFIFMIFNVAQPVSCYTS